LTFKVLSTVSCTFKITSADSLAQPSGSSYCYKATYEIKGRECKSESRMKKAMIKITFLRKQQKGFIIVRQTTTCGSFSFIIHYYSGIWMLYNLPQYVNQMKREHRLRKEAPGMLG
jgi:hypothetical protein